MGIIIIIIIIIIFKLLPCKNRKYKIRIESHMYKQIEKLMKRVHIFE